VKFKNLNFGLLQILEFFKHKNLLFASPAITSAVGWWMMKGFGEASVLGRCFVSFGTAVE